MKRNHYYFLLLLVLPLQVNADALYKCETETNGEKKTVITNLKGLVPTRSCKISTYPSTSSAQDNAPRTKASSTPTPADFPKVSSNTQKERDVNRRTILEQELANEQRNLDEARKAGNANKTQLHERNITALQKEIANLK